MTGNDNTDDRCLGCGKTIRYGERLAWDGVRPDNGEDNWLHFPECYFTWRKNYFDPQPPLSEVKLSWWRTILDILW